MDQVVNDRLRTHAQLEQITAALAEGVILLDSVGEILWANEAALAMHGVKSLKALGRNMESYCRRFELKDRNDRRLSMQSYPIARAVAGEKFGGVVVEVCRAGENEPSWIHSVRGYAVSGARGETDYLVLAIADLTEQYRAEDRFESAFNANAAPAVICRLSDLRYVRPNEGFLAMTGFARDEVVGRSAYEFDVLADAERRGLALERLKDWRTIPQMEACIPLRAGARKSVIVAGEPIRLSGERCMLFTFIDLDPLKKMEAALRQSEARFAKSFHLSPVPQIIAVLCDLRITEVNEAFRHMTGYSAAEAVGRTAAELGLWADETAQRRVEDALAGSGAMRGLNLPMRAKDGASMDCLVSTVTVTINQQSCVLCVIQDITERKCSEDGLIASIEAVMADTSWFSRIIVEKVAALRQATRPPPLSSGLDELTDREREILGLICQGQSDVAMSTTLGLSPNTVRNHVASLYRTIGVNRRSAAIIWARERGITSQEALMYKAPKKKSGSATSAHG
jgi:PAS domain S-box-containing protein